MTVSGAEGPGEPGQAPNEPNTDGPEGTTDEFDYRQAYEELRPKATQWSQAASEQGERLSEYEQLFDALQDPESQAEVLDRLGFELETGAPQGEDASLENWEDPLEAQIQELTSEVTDLRSQRELETEQQEESEIMQLRDDYIGEAVAYIEDQTERKFSDEAEEVLGNLAIAMEREDGVPDVQGAFNALYGKDGLVEAERGNWIKTKTGALQAPLGSSAPATKKPQTPRERAQYFDERLRVSEQDY